MNEDVHKRRMNAMTSILDVHSAKVSFIQFTGKARYVYIFSGQKFIRISNETFWVIFKQCVTLHSD